MAYVLVGSQGTVTNWIGIASDFYDILTDRISPSSSTIEIVAEEQDITSLGATTAAHIAGVRNVTGTITANAFATGRLGNVGLVTFTSGYVTHVREFDITIETIANHDITEFGGPSAAVVWRKFRPDLVRWSGRFVCGVDNATDLVFPHAPAASATALVLTYGDDSTDDTLSGNAFATRIGTGMTVGEAQFAEYTFMGTGDLTPAGTTSLFGTSVLGVPLWEYSTGSTVPRVLTLNNGNGTFIIADAFYTSMTLRCRIGEPVQLDINWQGSPSAASPTAAVTGTAIA